MSISYNTILELPNKKDTNDLPSLAGVYFIIKNNIIYYIGESIHIKKRVKEHRQLLKLLEPNIHYYLISEEKKRKRLEQDLITRYNPGLNLTNKKTSNFGLVFDILLTLLTIKGANNEKHNQRSNNYNNSCYCDLFIFYDIITN